MSTPATIERTTPAASEEDPQVSTGQPGASAAQESSADPTQASGAASEEPESRGPGPDYFRQAFQNLRGQTQSSAPQAPPASPGPAQEPERSASPSPDKVQTSAEDAGATSTVQPRQQVKPATQADQPKLITLTPEEFQRQVQAESDRKIAKIRKDEEARQAREQEVELRRTNPFEYARRMEQQEADQQAAQQKIDELNTTLSQQISLYDRHILDPLMNALPSDDARNTVITSVKEPGIPGRAKIAQGALKALESHWKDEGAKTARTRLMNDQSFVKEILARYGGQRTEPDPTPSLAVSSAPAPADENGTMNNWMRSGAAAQRQVTGR